MSNSLYHPKLCKLCKTSFIPTGARAAYCSGECQKESRKNYLKASAEGKKIANGFPKKVYASVHCQVCGKYFQPTNGNQRNCSTECSRTFAYRQQRARAGKNIIDNENRNKKIFTFCAEINKFIEKHPATYQGLLRKKIALAKNFQKS